MCNVSKSALGAGLDQCFSWDLVCNLEWPSWLGRTELIFGTSFRIRIRILLLGRTRSPIKSLISGAWNWNWNQNWDCFFNRLELKANCQFQSRLLGTGTEPNLSSKTRTRTQARSFLKNWTQKQISWFHLHVDPEAEVLSKEPPNTGLDPAAHGWVDCVKPELFTTRNPSLLLPVSLNHYIYWKLSALASWRFEFF